MVRCVTIELAPNSVHSQSGGRKAGKEGGEVLAKLVGRKWKLNITSLVNVTRYSVQFSKSEVTFDSHAAMFCLE